MRQAIIAGNWKMHKTAAEAARLCQDLKARLSDVTDVEVVVCPPFTALWAAREVLGDCRLALGAQDVSWEAEGAYTGEVSPGMLVDAGCTYVIVGHSERRQHFGETDEQVARKVRAALAAGLRPIVCVGETLEERREGRTQQRVQRQVQAVLGGLGAAQMAATVVAYEPIWAIGTGINATGGAANEVIGWIRRTVASLAGEEAAARLRIQYGGSVKPGNIREFMEQPEIDGALVGGASLEADAFAAIVRRGA